MEAIQVFRIDFCSLENTVGNAVSEKLLGAFIAKGSMSAHGRAAEFVKTLKIEPYLAWDGEVYPKLCTRKIQITG